MVYLYNIISVMGNGRRHIGCSAIMSQHSEICIKNSKFVGLHGTFGAAVMVSASNNITFAGNNKFYSNIASRGGSIYLLDSMLMLNGTNLFMNNTVGLVLIA